MTTEIYTLEHALQLVAEKNRYTAEQQALMLPVARAVYNHIPEDVRTAESEGMVDASSATASLAGTSLEQIEKRAIRETLRLTGGNREQAAKMLGIGERTLYRKLKDYGLR